MVDDWFRISTAIRNVGFCGFDRMKLDMRFGGWLLKWGIPGSFLVGEVGVYSLSVVWVVAFVQCICYFVISCFYQNMDL